MKNLLNGWTNLICQITLKYKGSSPHQVGKNSNDCHRGTENTEVFAACRYTAPAKDANAVVCE